MVKDHFIGVDVGTGSARAGVFSREGGLVASAKRNIALWQDGPDIAEQSSDDIWSAVCASVREALAVSGLGADAIAGIGFDATCSLVVLGQGGKPLPVGPHGKAERNIIVWMDHRATGQAARINRAGHRVLDYVGGVISPEMETPKLLWLKEKLPATYHAAWQFLDLADFLTWRATGSLDRSVCTVTCKWTYMAHEERWDESYFRQTGLGDLADQGFARIGTEIVPAGQALGAGLTPAAAGELGLNAGTPVGAGLIDAHAGGLGTVGGTATTTMAYVLGTSACTMASSAEPIFIPGVWGPYHSAMVPGLWLNEGGQSSAGAAIDQTVALHPATPEARATAASKGLSLPDFLAGLAAEKAGSPPEAVRLAGNLVVVPDFLGNRSPQADPEARAAMAGLGMERDLDSLVSLYVAGILGLGYGLRQIVEASRGKGAAVETIALSGGAGRHPLVRQLLADCTGVPVAVSRQAEPVLLGAAMLGATASGVFANLGEAMQAMTGDSETFTPAAGDFAALHARRFAAFETLQRAARDIRNMMTES
ncbi:MAG: FGGY-family carbohydrate kinase [Rhizobiaceae bacterium]